MKITWGELYRYFRFLVGGGLSLLLNLGVTYVLTEYFHLWYMLSFAIALALEILFLFLYHSQVTFQSQGRFLRFVLGILFISALNWAGVYLVTVPLGVHYLIAIPGVALIISLLNYWMNRTWVFDRT